MAISHQAGDGGERIATRRNSRRRGLLDSNGPDTLQREAATACGLRWARRKMMRLVLEKHGALTTLLFPRLPVRIGRNLDADCRLDCSLVSRQHAQIDLEEGRLVLRDLGSRHGTWVLGGRYRLQPSEAVDLALVGWEFFIGAGLRVHVHPQSAATDDAKC
jgi:hypothetical protein